MTNKTDKTQTTVVPAQTLTIDGVEYNAADLSDNAKNQIMNLRVTDQEIGKRKGTGT